MPDPRDTLKRAAELLRENIHDSGDCDHQVGICFCEDKWIAAALDRMAEQEPVAWLVTKPVDVGVGTDREVVLQWEPGLDDEESAPLYAAPVAPADDARDAAHPLDVLLPELCQLLDAFKREAESNGDGWTEWDESVRARLRKCLADYNIYAMKEPK